MASVFFVGKKNGKKRMVQDYRYLNEWAIKNNYPLSLILDIVENISAKKVFMKLDLRQDHNNVWPKKKDEWKAFFMTPERLFESTVIFFRLTNSLVTFQTIMNKILQDLINTGKVASFIENVIVETEEKKEHNEIVEKIVKGLAENDLYIKLEKYKWKVRKVEFLEVLIGPEGIKMEEEKMKKVLYQLTSKGVKNTQKFLGLANYYWQFRKRFLFIARLLHSLVKKYQKWD